MRTLSTLVAFTLCVMMYSTARGQQILHVSTMAAGVGDGSSWANAFIDLQDALAAAQAGDEIWIRQGIHYPTSGVDRSIFFALVPGVSLYGGFGGWETSVHERDWELYPTTLSGNIGAPSDSLDNSYCVARAYYNFIGERSILDGLIFEDGQANGTGLNNSGALLRAESASILVRNCTFRSGHADGNGGAMSISNSHITIFNCRFENNVGLQSGGAIRSLNIAGSIEGCSFVNNRSPGSGSTTSGNGGAVSGNMMLVDCSFIGNLSNHSGGAVSSGQNTIVNCRFEGNQAGGHGGAISITGLLFNVYESVFLDNRTTGSNRDGGAIHYDGGVGGAGRVSLLACRFIGNQSTRDGGAIGVSNNRLTIQNTEFNGNSAGRRGGAVSFIAGQGWCRLLNSTFIGNNATEEGKVIYEWAIASDATLMINCIYWENAEPEIETHPNGAQPILDRCLYQGSIPGTDLFNDPPLFVSQNGADGIPGTEDDDLRLALGSPYIDLGTADTTGLDLFHVDASGNMRIVNTVDVGAYEHLDCALLPSSAQAPPDTVICGNVVFFMQADTPAVGIGRWRLVHPGSGWLSAHPTIRHLMYSPYARFSGFPLGDSYFEWSVSHCGVVSRDTVKVTRLPTPVTPSITINGPTALCPGGLTTLAAPGAAGDLIWSTGDTATTIQVGPGTYTVSAAVSASCISGPSEPVTITTAPVPPAPVIQADGPTDLCQGVAQSVTLSASGTSGQYLWSTGDTTATILVDSTGTFALQVVNAQGCISDPSDSLVVTLHALPAPPTLSAIGDTTLCHGESLTVTVAESAHAYLWSNGATTPQITVSGAGQYHLLVQDTFGCQSPSSDTIVVGFHPPLEPVIVPDGPTSFCQGGSVLLGLDLPYAAQTWSNGQTGPTIEVSTPGQFTVTATDGFGCQGTSDAVSVTVHPLPPQPMITATFVSNGVINLSTAFLAGATYAWFRNDVPIPGATTHQLNAITDDGPFRVEVTDANGCMAGSATFIGPVGIDDMQGGNDPVLFPNPSTGSIHVNGPWTVGAILDIHLFDRSGRTLWTQQIVAGSLPSFRLEMGQLANGSYLLHIAGPYGSTTLPYVIAR